MFDRKADLRAYLPTSNLRPARLPRTLRRGGTLISGLATASLVVTLAMAAPGKAVHHHHLHTAAVPQDAQASAAPAQDTSQDTSPVVARMGNLELHADQTQKLIANLNASDRAAVDKNPDLLARVLRGLVADRFVLAQALAKHWDQQPAVAAALERMRENAIMQSYVQAAAAPPPDYPNEADLAEAYEANKSALMAPKQYEVAQIFVAAKTGADTSAETQARNKILAIARELRTPGADFAAIAKTESQAKATAANGGIIGWLSEAQLRPDIKPHILALAPGAISAPIRLDDGWQILKLVDVHPPRQLDLSEVHDVLKQKMRQQRAQDLQRAWLADLVKANPISLDQSELIKLVGATGAATR
ncbi:MAG: peptidylprolyl isomerase [Methylovirgula sp.]|uniref:peptidylprolyl isomerase n=1 Tax=Methylovirgula sp. TaxID=1978224 RepID=UPI003075F275